MAKVIDVAALQAWLLNNQREEGVTPPPPPPTTYTCPKCGQSFSTQALLNSHIYSAHPVTPPTPGPIPPGWEPINNRMGTTSFFGGYFPNAQVPPPTGYLQARTGIKYNFYIDPSVAGSGRPTVHAGDQGQAIPAQCTLSRLDASYNKILLPIPMVGGNCQYTSQWPKTQPYAGEKLLLEVVPSGDCQMFIWWSLS